MARTVGARELKVRLGTHLRRVREGRTLVITDRGVPVAELRPIASGRGRAAALAALEARGVVTPPANAGMPAFSPIRLRGDSLASTVVKDREDRF